MPICPNCGSAAVADYCSQCGQRYHTAHSLREFARSVAHDQIGVDAKVPRTLKALFLRPGFLTTEYMAGRIVRYIPPFRLYLLASVLFFVLLSFLSVRQDWGGVAGRQIEQGVQEAWDSVAAADSAAQARGSGMKVGVSFDRRAWLNDVSVNIPWKWLDDKIEQNLVELGKLPPDVATRRITSAIIEELPKVMFLLLPVFALLLKLLYSLRKRPYLEHFIFALHLHAFVFLLFIAVLVVRAPYVAGIVALVIAIYSFIAMKRVYGQGYVMTSLKWFALAMAYMTLVSVGMVFALIWAFALVSAV